jgi:cholesterol oxidase
MAGAREKRFDAVVVGSGFGGSVMAYRLAAAGLDVCLLERGKAWSPGSFPRTPYEFSRALWDPSAGLHGLYDVWSFGGLGALVSSGLGGGSLIYANVILEKPERWFEEVEADGTRRWPVTYDDLRPHYEAVRPFLEAVPYPERYRESTPKTRAFHGAAERLGLDPSFPPLAVTFGDHGPGLPFGSPAANLHDAQRFTCRLVGECDVGCNYGSKNSLDYTYLSKAESLGLKICCRHEVKAFARDGDGFRIEVADHSRAEEGRARAGPAPTRVLLTRRLILAAGSLGTPYLLLRNRSAFPHISPLLGTRFSGNGDFIAFAARSPTPMQPSLGPVITVAVEIPDTLDGGSGPGFFIEDGGYASFLAWVGQMIALPRIGWAGRRTALRVAWGKLTGRPDSNLSAEAAALLGSPRLTGGTLPLLGMGRERPLGRMRLGRGGLLDVEWSFAEARQYFDRVRSTVRAIAQELGGEFEDNVLWRLNASVTAHPLGGCPLGLTSAEGVVDPVSGGVHNYPNLHIADGSVMPGTVGTNPSFTIAALSNRFADAILREEGKL